LIDDDDDDDDYVMYWIADAMAFGLMVVSVLLGRRSMMGRDAGCRFWFCPFQLCFIPYRIRAKATEL
jgi:hypothetical protein